MIAFCCSIITIVGINNSGSILSRGVDGDGAVADGDRNYSQQTPENGNSDVVYAAERETVIIVVTRDRKSSEHSTGFEIPTEIHRSC